MLQPLWFMFWEKKDKRVITWISWDHLATPEQLGAAAVLNLDMCLMTRRFSLQRDMC